MKRTYVKEIAFALIFFSIAYVAMAQAPTITKFTPGLQVNDTEGASRTFSVNVNPAADVTWYIGKNQVQLDNNVSVSTYTNNSATPGTWIVNATARNANGSDSREWTWIVTTPLPGAPALTGFSPPLNVVDTENASRTFSINANQTVDVTWYIDDREVMTESGKTTSSYINTSAVQGTWIVNATVRNSNGMASKEWTWTVKPPSPVILTYAPAPPVSDIDGTSRPFNITVSQNVSVTWYIDRIEVLSENGVTASNYNNSSAVAGRWIVNVTATNANGADSREWIWNVKDITPPGNITNLSVADRGYTYIKWTWIRPPDPDFNGTRIYIDNISITTLPGTSNEYNATGFAPGTSHKITVVAFDNSANDAAEPWPANTSATLPNTPPGDDVTPIGLPSNVTINFKKVTGEGNTTVNFTGTSNVEPDFVPLDKYVDITSTANFTGAITIELKYSPPGEKYNESSVRLYHLNNSGWEDITTRVDQANNIVTGEVTGLSLFVAGVFPPPKIDIIEQPPSLEVTVKDSLFFEISVDQEASVAWKIDGNTSQGPSLIEAGGTSNFTFPRNVVGNYSITVEAGNLNGTTAESWNVTVHPRFFFEGNRIWDGSRPDEFSLNYTWTPMSFSGFYYDINDDVGDESITINLDSYTDRTINTDDLVYTTSPQEVSFGYSGFGSYEVIGFMAEKYFAGYTSGSTPPNPSTGLGKVSTLAQGQLHKVLMDDDTQRTISLGSTITLNEGYVLKAIDIDAGARTMLMSLIKDGDEVDKVPLSAGQTYVYTKRVGAVSDLSIIMVRFDSVFSGREVQAAFLRGMFQISESYATVDSGNRFGIMEVSSVSGNSIEMRNDASISLSAGSIQDLMGDIKIIVADNSAVRFALSVEKTQGFEVRSSIYREDDTIEEWTPYNFGMNIGKTSIGFYYDLDEGIGNEELKLIEPLNGSRTITDGNLLYTTSPQEVDFGYSGFGKYEAIGFMADKYFAGYTSSSTPPDPTTSIGSVSTISQGQLHRVLIDDDTKRTISLGSTLTLQEGYVLKAVDIDPGARTMLISLLKDGIEVDTAAVSAGRTYVYTKKVGTVSDLPIIMVRLDSVFSGRETSAAFLTGIFQISEDYATVESGNKFGKMEVQTVSNDRIDMVNDGSISLDQGDNEILMGNLRLKVGDTKDNTLRFYFAVDVTQEMVANLLVIDAPDKANAGEPINIKITAGGNPADGVSIELDSNDIGLTDANGSFAYDIPRSLKGTHNITATKLGYLKAEKNIEIIEYIERRLNIESPVTANQFETITMRVTSNGTAVGGAALRYDNTTIGSTDVNGTLNYTLEASGTHSISASKSGYITVEKDIEVRAPYSEYKALDINISPNVVFTNEPVVIRSNITNTGTKKDILPVELIINGTAVDNTSVALAPGEIKGINFTHKEPRAGNYSVEILGQEGLLEVKQGFFTWNLILIVLLITALGALAVYLMTSKNKISIDSLRKRLIFKKDK